MDGYGITECGSLACLSNPCRNGARCIEVQPRNDADELEDNTIGLSAVNRHGRRPRRPLTTLDHWTGRDENQQHSNRFEDTMANWGRQDDRLRDGRQGSGIMDDYRHADDEDDDYLLTAEDENNNWQCKCPTGYIGATCEISVCDNNPCQYGGTCIPYPGSGYLCLCPFGKHGHYCEHSEYHPFLPYVS